jgi:2-polyprenyl-6-methoxyphenol hydroxylase-like FAD-dependent oxidoreductase
LTVARAVVAGAGPAGLAMATALRLAGAEVVLVERAPADRIVADVGSGYELTSTALDILDALGVDVRACGIELARFELRAIGGRRLQTLDLTSFPIWSVTRSDLQRALWRRLEALGCTLLTSTTIESISPGPVVRLSSGAVIEADVVIGADGMRSSVRRLLFDPREPRDLGLAAWWGAAPTDAADLGLERGQTLGIVGPGRSCVIAHAGDRLLWTVCATGAPELGDVARTLPVEGLIARSRAVAGTRILEQHSLTRWWSPTHRTLVIGDAAHGMAPFLGLGANAALEDASQLTAALGCSWEAVEAVARERAARLGPAIGTARRIGRVMHARSRIAHAIFRGVVRILPRALVLRELRARHRPRRRRA